MSDLFQQVFAQLVENAVRTKNEYLDALRNRDYTKITQRATNYTHATDRLAEHTGWPISRINAYITQQLEDKDAENPS